MASNQPDLSAYPVIRIDHIPLVDSKVLRESASEVAELIDSMNSDEGTKPPLLYYLRKQLEAMESELIHRSATDRINSMLTGVTLSDSNIQYNTARASIKASAQDDSNTAEHSMKASGTGSAPLKRGRDRTPSTSSSSAPFSVTLPIIPKPSSAPIVSEIKTKKNENIPQKAVYKRIPLPSELAWQENSKIIIDKEKEKDKESAVASSSENKNENKNERMTLSSSGPQSVALPDDDENENENTPMTGRSRFTETETEGEADSVSNSDNESSRNSTQRIKRISNTTANTNLLSKSKIKGSRRSASMSNNDVEVGSPTKKAQQALYKDFGSQFLVAGTEKKLRFYPTKVVIESVEDVRERERTDRFVLTH